MKLLIQNNRVAGTATDEYDGPEFFIPAPDDFDISRMGEYRYVDEVLAIEPGTRLTKLAFRNRFTQAEKIALERASLDNPAAPMAARRPSTRPRSRPCSPGSRACATARRAGPACSRGANSRCSPSRAG